MPVPRHSPAGLIETDDDHGQPRETSIQLPNAATEPNRLGTVSAVFARAEKCDLAAAGFAREIVRVALLRSGRSDGYVHALEKRNNSMVTLYRAAELNSGLLTHYGAENGADKRRA
jgi:hypothetical protein